MRYAQRKVVEAGDLPIDSGLQTQGASSWARVWYRGPARELFFWRESLRQRRHEAIGRSRYFAGYSARGCACPRCSGIVSRVARRLVDRVANCFTSTRRYHCHSMGCGWEGNLRVKRFRC